jgi:hypothetical protein
MGTESTDSCVHACMCESLADKGGRARTIFSVQSKSRVWNTDDHAQALSDSRLHPIHSCRCSYLRRGHMVTPRRVCCSAM